MYNKKEGEDRLLFEKDGEEDALKPKRILFDALLPKSGTKEKAKNTDELKVDEERKALVEKVAKTAATNVESKDYKFKNIKKQIEKNVFARNQKKSNPIPNISEDIRKSNDAFGREANIDEDTENNSSKFSSTGIANMV